ncbi:hypothetical protein BDA96_02G026200 [Sorghum bicolor]|uniref:DUF4220 domain-containing protein n=1 Tax=Sorghum bicolor TaxID=4558 RepID=A0A921RLD1_SORBI|nr:hypothetical protein BDA96_02G026200 [Sorghum bicolor]
MARNNATTSICYNDAALRKCSSNISCSHEFLGAFIEIMGGKMWRVNMLIVMDAVLAGVIVVIGAYARRYRYHSLTRFIFLGATTLYLPIISYVVSTIGSNTNDYIHEDEALGTLTAATCHGGFHQFTVVSWAFLVQIVVTNTSVIVAFDDKEGRNKGPPVQLLVQGIWTLYLGVSVMGPIKSNKWQFHLELMLFAVIFAKIVLKYYAFEKARHSLAFGRNPRLISGYMKHLQLQEASELDEPWAGQDAHPPPPLLVMGEDDIQVEKKPHGYVCKDLSRGTLINRMGIVTFDKVWQLDDDRLAMSRPQLKDICLSFSLFKLLRCRFARYEFANAGSMRALNNFFSLLLKEGNHARVFGVIVDELSFIQDYYYSSLPVSYSKYWLPILSVSISFLSIVYCLVAGSFIIKGLVLKWEPKYEHQMRCHLWCSERYLISDMQKKYFGHFLFDDVPLFFLLALVVMAEANYIASYICSNWTKVALICHYIRHASLQHSLRVQKWFVLLLQCKWELMKHWDEKMGQSSILVVHPRTTPLVLLRRLLGLPDLDRSVKKIPEAVKVCIMHTMTHYISIGQSNGKNSLLLSQAGGERFLWACSSSSGTSDIILTWHIATCILEVRHPYQCGQEHGSWPYLNYKIAATHLSRYCTYLMAWSPDLLPDHEEWSTRLYEMVKNDAKRALSECSCTAVGPEAEYEQVIQLLSVNSRHEVIKKGVVLGKQLVELMEGQETAWMVLAEFWSEMILYIAPSDNVRGHLEAIARGGELITLLWALLSHVGIVSRPGDAAGTATNDASSAPHR